MTWRPGYIIRRVTKKEYTRDGPIYRDIAYITYNKKDKVVWLDYGMKLTEPPDFELRNIESITFDTSPWQTQKVTSDITLYSFSGNGVSVEIVERGKLRVK